MVQVRRRSHRHPEERRAEILEAAAKVFAEKGFYRSGIADIAQEAGTGHGTFYRYFRNKRDIFEQVMDELVRRLAEGLGEEPPEFAGSLAEYRAQAERWGGRLFDLFQGDLRVAAILLREAVGIDPEMRRKVDEVFDVAADVTELYLRHGRESGYLRADLDTRLTARAINAIASELTAPKGAPAILKRGSQAADRQRAIEAGVSLIFDGIGAPEKSPAKSRR